VTAEELVIPPPTPRLIPYPGLIGIAALIVFTAGLLIIIDRFDGSHGILAISLLIVLAFIGVTIFCLFFTIPNDQVTAGVIGGLIAAFGAVVAHFIGKSNGTNGPPK
jgi:uncharacterized BrkB/YihY/UPF0761 family membrane protein